MAFDDEILLSLIKFCKQNGIYIGHDVALSLQKLFVAHQISAQIELDKARGLIIPVIAKNANEQRLLNSLIDKLVNLERREWKIFLQSAESLRAQTIWEKISYQIRTNIWRLTLLSALVFFAVALYNLEYSRKELKMPSIRIKHKPGSVIAAERVTFTCVTDSFYNFKFDWDFGDGTVLKGLVKDSVQHVYKRSGVFKLILLIRHGQQDFMFRRYINVQKAEQNRNPGVDNYQKSAGAKQGKAPAPMIDSSLAYFKRNYPLVPLKEYKPLVQQGIAVSLTNDFGVLKITLITIFCIILGWLIFYRQLPKNLVNLHFDLGKKLVMPLKVYINEKYLAFDNKKMDDLARVFKTSGDTGYRHFDVKESILKTVSRSGFPVIAYKSDKIADTYLLLIESGPNNNIISKAVHALADELILRGVEIRVFQYTSFNHIYGDGFKSGTDLQNLSTLFERSQLIIYGTGIHFLNDYTSSGYEDKICELLLRWEKRVLFSYVPRSNWGTAEKRLLRMISIYECTIEGHTQFGASLHSGKYILSDRSHPFFTAPVPHDINLYKKLFVTEYADEPLYVWLCALALPDEIEWNLLLLVGKLIEKKLDLKPGELVNFDNIILLNYVGFVKKKILPVKHKVELIKILKKNFSDIEIIEDIYEQLIAEYQCALVPEGSTAAVTRNIKIVSLEFKLNPKMSVVHKNILSELQEKGLLDAYTSNLVKRTKDYNARSKYFQNIIYLIGVFFFCLSCLDVAEKYHPEFQLYNFNQIVAVDSSVYYNNLAVSFMKPRKTMHDSTIVSQLLMVSLRYNRTNDTAKYNYFVYQYRKGIAEYKRHNYYVSKRTFGALMSEVSFYHPIEKSKLRFTDDPKIYTSAAMEKRLMDMKKHACFNISACTSYEIQDSVNYGIPPRKGMFHSHFTPTLDSTAQFKEFEHNLRSSGSLSNFQ